MKKILLPTDFSDNARQAIDFAFQLFDQIALQDVRFVLLHAYQMATSVPVYGEIPPSDMFGNAGEEEFRLQELYHSLQEIYPESAISYRFMVGPVQVTMETVIEEEDIDLVIMGTHGASGLEEQLFGSNAARAAKGLKCPVLIIPEGVTFVEPRRIIFATDFQNLDNLNILNPLQAIVRKFDPHFLTVHILPEGETPDKDKERMNRILYTYFDSLKYSHYFLEGKDPVEAVENFIHEHKADWLVLVGQERKFLESLFHRSVIRKMAYHTAVPLLVLH